MEVLKGKDFEEENFDVDVDISIAIKNVKRDEDVTSQILNWDNEVT